MVDDLYNTDILTRAASLRNTRLRTPHGTSRKVSKLCGSALEIDIMCEDGRVSDVALRVQACALGQASAAILHDNIIGANLQELTVARNALENMLRDGGDPPEGRFSDLNMLSAVANYPARHKSTLLAFDAAVDAMLDALSFCAAD